MDENSVDCFLDWPTGQGRRRAGFPYNIEPFVLENSAAPSSSFAAGNLSSPSRSSRSMYFSRASSSVGPTPTLDGGSTHRPCPDWSLEDEFRRFSLRRSDGEFLRRTSLIDENVSLPEYAYQSVSAGMTTQYQNFLTGDQSSIAPSNSNHLPSAINSNFEATIELLRSMMSLVRLRGKMVSMARGQDGSRALQTLMEGFKTELEVQFVLDELSGHICALMGDEFGNYVVKKLIEICSEDQITRILALKSFQDQFARVSLGTDGSRVIQSLLDRVDPQNSLQVSLVMRALNPYAITLANNINGQHIVLHCLRHFPVIYNQKLLIAVAYNCLEVGMNKSGCCVLQQCVNKAQDVVKLFLLAEITGNAVQLSNNRYGNYAVQHVISLRMRNVNSALMRELEGHFQALSMNKYASNVVEKCLRAFDEHQVKEIITELVQSPGVSRLLVDEFGNYVVQFALNVSKGKTRKALIDAIVWNSASMQSNLYGKKILTSLEKKKMVHW